MLSSKKIPAVGVAMFGLIVAVLGIVFLIVDFDQVDTCSHGRVMDYCIDTPINVTTITPTVSS